MTLFYPGLSQEEQEQKVFVTVYSITGSLKRIICFTIHLLFQVGGKKNFCGGLKYFGLGGLPPDGGASSPSILDNPVLHFDA